MNKEITTFLVIKASTIAIIGGINVNTPKLFALTTEGFNSSANAIVVDNVKIIIVNKIALNPIFFTFLPP
jgi:hypothetical protein